MPEIPTQPAIPLEISPLIQQIDEIIDANGKVPQQTKDALLFSVTKSMLIQMNRIEYDMKEINKIDGRVRVLENKNIVIWATQHPAVSIFFITLVMILLLQHYASAVLDFFGITLPIP